MGLPPSLRGSGIHLFLVNCLSVPRIERRISLKSYLAVEYGRPILC